MRKTIELHKRWKDDPSKGEVFTPEELVREMLDKIPTSVWENPTSTFLDPCMGKGTFLIDILRRLTTIYGYSVEDAMSRIYGYDVRVKYINYLKRGGFVNVFHKDFLSENIDMKFDVVVGNPPYQSNTENVGAGHTLWNKFVIKSLKQNLKNGGYSCLVHPSGWRNISGSFDDVKQLIKERELQYLEIHDINDGLKTFGASTRYDICVVKNLKNTNTLTTIVDEDGKTTKLNVKNFDYIPNGSVKFLGSLVVTENEEKVELCFSHSSYDPRKNWMSNEMDDNHTFPCVKYISKTDNTIDLRYSSVDKGMFGTPKVMFGIGSQVGGIIPDYEGEYGLCQFVAGIVDKKENLDNIAKAMKSNKFKKLMKDCQFTTQMYNYKVISTFKKDFWKEFIDE